MQLPDGSTLMHGSAPYDPVKAHEYYLKVRELKGRKKGSAVPPKARQGAQPKQAGPSFTVTSAKGTVKLSPKEYAEQKAYAAQRVAQISSKLHTLESELHKKMAAAKQKEHASKQTAKDNAKPDTAAEKHQKAKDAAQYRDKHKQELKTKAKKAASKQSHTSAAKPDLNTVSGLKTAIEGVKKSLHAAIERQRSLASAKKN